MPSTEKLDTHRKALTLNLDTSKFGSFVEIGAGQEVARWFLAVGGASGTVSAVTALIEWLKSVMNRDVDKGGPTYSATLVVESTLAIVFLHGLAILLWAGFYRSRCFPSWELAFYFSASSYSTVGYGDLVLPSKWWLLGPLEGIIGVLM
jgi:Ion channel